MDDPGNDAEAPAPTPPVPLYQSLVESAFEFIATFDSDGIITFANQAALSLIGRRPDELVGSSIIELVHPDDMDRALQGIATQSVWGAPLGTTSFRVLHADGSFVTLDVTAADVSDGERDLLAVYSRPADYQHATDEVLARLLTGGDRSESLAPVLDVFAWELNGSRIAISWFEEDLGHRYVSTGLPGALAGAEAEPGRAWAAARERFEGMHDPDQSLLDPARRRLAAEHGRGAYWIEPVADAATGVPALVTVWSRAGGRPPEGHSYGMSVARNFVELILRWSDQVGQLDAAAHRDPLTRLANRKVFFDTLEAERAGGAVLYCDLDRFKPVNDELGHAAGDELLRQVAVRIAASVRSGDVVARLGGDEFGVLARGASTRQAGDLAERITRAFESPFTVSDTTVEIGISIGVAHEAGQLTDLTLEAADRALYRAKGEGRSSVQWAD